MEMVGRKPVGVAWHASVALPVEAGARMGVYIL